MKKYFLILIIIFLLISCSKDEVIEIEDEVIEIEDEVIEIEDEINLAPNNFDLTIDNISDSYATINWTEAQDPEGDVVSYNIYLNENLKTENFSELSYQLTELNELTSYSGKVLAVDSNNNETSKTFSFTTEKYYLKFLKEYYFESYETVSYSSPTNMIRTMEGGYVIIGNSFKADGSGYRSFALKIDTEGNEVWKHFYGYEVNPGSTFKITQSQDGGFILASFHIILKIDSNGNEVWHTINNNYELTSGEMYSAKEDSQGNIFVVGYRDPLNYREAPTSHFGVLTKLNNLGQIIWEKEFKSSYRSTFADLIIDPSDNIIILGTAETSGVTENVYGLPNGAEQIDPWVIKTDNNGDIIWDKYYLNIGFNFTNEIIKTNDGNYVFTGSSWGAYDIGAGLICKITPNGDEVWRNNIPLSSVLSIDETIDGGFISVGHINGSFDILGICKLTSNGNEEWSKSYQQGFTHLRGKKIIQTEDEGYIFISSCGKNYYYGDERAKILIYKTDPEGNYD